MLGCVCALPVCAVRSSYASTEQQQQTASVKGIVVDASGEPLIGVSVKVKGSSDGTVSDFDGRFVLKVAEGSVLQFSYIGYKTAEVKATRGEMRVVLNADSELLSEVVVVAYGKQKKVTVTGSVAAIGSDAILQSPAANVEASLAGRIPGLTALQGSGEPGRDDVTFYLRGVGTTNGKAPLILVDGVPRDNISTINSHEIETISVLKDASATAVFGVRGANGVILITTKRGQKGKVSVSATVEYSMQRMLKRPDPLDSYDMAVLRNEALANDGIAPEYSQADLDAYYSWRTGNPTDPYGHPNHNWIDLLFRDYAPQTRVNLNVSGGSERTQYFISTGYLHQGGMFNVESKSDLGYDPQSKMDRYNFRSNLDHQLNRNIKLSLDISSYIEKVNGTSADLGTQVLPWAMVCRPTQPGPLTVADYPLFYYGTLTDVPVGGVMVERATAMNPSPYGMMNRSGYKLETRSGLNAILNVDIDLGFITPGLSTKGMVSFESKATSVINATRNYMSYYLEPLADGTTVFQPAVTTQIEDGSIALGKSQISNYFINLQWYLNYNRNFAKHHNVGAMLLFQRDYREADEWSGYTDKYLPFNVLGLSGRITYDFDSKYLFELNVGYNGSEQFSPNKRFGFFPAFSLGWVATEERFIKENARWLTALKLRGSFGKVGNDQIGARRFLYLDNISVGGKYVGHDWDNGDWTVPSLGNPGNQFIQYQYIGNPDVSWEVAEKLNLGVDLTVFRDFSLTFDYFTEHRDNVLIDRNTIPILQGLPSTAFPKVNMGKVKNHGFEFTLGYNHVFNKHYAINASINYSYSKNRVTEFDELVLDGNQRDENGNITKYGYAYTQRATGFSIGQQWGYKIDYSVDRDDSGNLIPNGRDGSGYFNSQESIDQIGLTYEIGTPKPGDFVYVDANGDGIINDKDLVPIGYSSLSPRTVYGFNLGGRVKGLDISLLFQGVGQFTRGFDGWGTDESKGNKGGFYREHLGRWSQQRYLAGEPITHPRLGNGGGTSHQNNDYWLMDASYLRLKNVEIGYTFPVRWVKTIGAQSLRIYANGNNLITWDHLNTDVYDPEQNIQSYPVMRTYNIGLNVVF